MFQPITSLGERRGDEPRVLFASVSIALMLIKASAPSARWGTVAVPNNNLPAGERGGALMNFYKRISDRLKAKVNEIVPRRIRRRGSEEAAVRHKTTPGSKPRPHDMPGFSV